MDTLIVLIVFLAFLLVAMALMEMRERKRQKAAEQACQEAIVRGEELQPEKLVRVPVDDECCGRHAVCERESLLTATPDIVYYDDEDLDRLSGIAPEQYTSEDLAAVQEVFYTMQDKDVAGWLRSLQLRHITIPQELMDEALMIVAERRFERATTAAH